MPDLLLLDTDVVVADAWHRVTAPGGYEWWHFDAQDSTGSVLVVADFHAGFVFHPQYLRRFDRYQRKPTRHSPPSPMEYCCAQLAVYENGRRLGGFTRRYRPEEFSASTSDFRVTIGPNHLTTDGGDLRLHAQDSSGLCTIWVFDRFWPIHRRSRSFSPGIPVTRITISGSSPIRCARSAEKLGCQRAGRSR